MKEKAAAIAGLSLLLATAAHGQTFQGKKISLFSGPAVDLPDFDASATVASIPLPEKYKSKTSFLLVTTMVQESCSSNIIASDVAVAGNSLLPGDGISQAIECDNSSEFKMVTRQWFLPPESQGGPAIPSGSTIDLTLTYDGASATIGAGGITIKAEMEK